MTIRSGISKLQSGVDTPLSQQYMASGKTTLPQSHERSRELKASMLNQNKTSSLLRHPVFLPLYHSQHRTKALYTQVLPTTVYLPATGSPAKHSKTPTPATNSLTHPIKAIRRAEGQRDRSKFASIGSCYSRPRSKFWPLCNRSRNKKTRKQEVSRQTRITV